jgi:hypothetical protein
MIIPKDINPKILNFKLILIKLNYLLLIIMFICYYIPFILRDVLRFVENSLNLCINTNLQNWWTHCKSKGILNDFFLFFLFQSTYCLFDSKTCKVGTENSVALLLTEGSLVSIPGNRGNSGNKKFPDCCGEEGEDWEGDFDNWDESVVWKAPVLTTPTLRDGVFDGSTTK